MVIYAVKLAKRIKEGVKGQTYEDSRILTDMACERYEYVRRVMQRAMKLKARKETIFWLRQRMDAHYNEYLFRLAVEKQIFEELI